MKVLNYLNLNEQLMILRFHEDRTANFKEVYHAHQGMEMLYIHEGCGQVVLDRSIYPLQPGSLLIIRPFQLHRIQMFTGPDAPYIRSLFVFEPYVLDKYLAAFPSLRELFHHLVTDKKWKQVVTLDAGEFGQLCRFGQRRIAEAQESERLEQRAWMLISILTLLKPRMENKLAFTSEHMPAVERIIQWIDHHYMQSFELEALAKAVHLSSVYVSKLFRKSVGSSITEYLTARRIQQACWLLKTEELSVKEIGEAVGISNASYFCQLFKANTGISPYQYKKLFYAAKGEKGR
ncbi:AraC family transcriptional regulator [Paenibacillus cremeus]|uniref:Helix-turn-helix domain-containing protein n=1 Tax=Paenibacillus cremeus TaxID=2163881 RepID=A0A559KHX8_9BACL|nr:AraC family transcriptional regulator [Paenibacillus cremeus]TVY11745.1 helix-turn-helix domain-containing protein [Paenibacillus cremeus]